jgi:hypothetical protein
VLVIFPTPFAPPILLGIEKDHERQQTSEGVKTPTQLAATANPFQ